MLSVKWDAPGSRHHGIVHLVSESLVDQLGGGRVAVWWPSRAKGKRWEGEQVYATSVSGKSSVVRTCSLVVSCSLQLHVMGRSLEYVRVRIRLYIIQRSCSSVDPNFLCKTFSATVKPTCLFCATDHKP